MGTIRTYRDLDIWKTGIEVVKDTYRLTNEFPKHELYGLTRQVRRSAVSIPSNVTEGFRRRHNKEYARFLGIALGSCAELETQATIARELDYMASCDESQMLEKLDHECRMIANLMKKLES